VKPLTSKIKSMADKSKTKKWKSEGNALKERCCVENKGRITCMIRKQSASVHKEYNFRRHSETKYTRTKQKNS
jgi:hypothetical protein